MILFGPNGLTKEIIINLSLSDWCGALPFQWNHDTNRLEQKSPRKQLTHKIRVCVGVIYMAFAILQVSRIFKNGTSLLVTTHSAMFAASAIFASSFQLVNCTNCTRIVNLCNGLFDYEKKFVRRRQEMVKPSLSDRYIKYMIQLMTCTGIAMPITYHLDIIRNPCFPMYVGYWLSDQCDERKLGVPLNPTRSAGEFGVNLGISLVSYVNWSILMGGCLFETSLELIVHGHCLKKYIQEYERNLLQTRRIDESTIKSTSSYRYRQLICTEYRALYSRFVVGTAIPCVVTMETMCLYNTIQLFSGNDQAGSLGYNVLYMWSGCVCFCLIIVVFGLLADVYKVSKRAQRNLQSKLVLQKDRWFRRWLRSCPVLRVYFGGSNYLDELTPLTLENFAINQTLNLLLIKQ